jgi:triacylglycerol lipase
VRKIITAVAITAFLAPAASASAKDPIVFVHGWNSSGSTWNTMIARFKADGYTTNELQNWSYNTSQSNATTASQLATRIDQAKAATGAAKVDVVTHSMGALSSRYYLKNLGGTANVDDWVSLGGPNHGTDTATLCAIFLGQTSCKEMQPGSAFLTALNSVDETPGTVTYGTWWSPCDEVINPDSSVPISGATNTQTACMTHSNLHEDATVYGQVRDFIK